MNNSLTSNEIDTALDGLLDELASIEHDRWSHWQRYMHEQCVAQQDGSLLIPAASVRQWTNQMKKSFSMLSDKEKDSDRDQVLRYLPLIKRHLEKIAKGQ